jgi:hypothetical protein
MVTPNPDNGDAPQGAGAPPPQKQKGEHNLLMHIDTEKEDMPHSLENICRDKASDVMTKPFELSRWLPSHLETVNNHLKT